MTKVLASNTSKNYRSYFHRFLSFLKEKHVCFQNFSEADVLSYLESLKNLGRAFGTISVARSSIIYFASRSGRPELSTSLLLKDYMKAVKRSSTPSQERADPWDPNTFLSFVLSRPISLPFLDIAAEALLLLLLATGLRIDDVMKLSKNYSIIPGGIRLRFLRPRKADVYLRSLPAHQDVAAYHDKRICPVAALHRYMLAAQPLRRSSDDFLFISSEGTPAARATLGRWVRTLLHAAGINATPGSCRSATTSAAYMSDVHIHEILSSAGWRSENTFRRFYNRPAFKPLNLFAAYVTNK